MVRCRVDRFQILTLELIKNLINQVLQYLLPQMIPRCCQVGVFKQSIAQLQTILEFLQKQTLSCINYKNPTQSCLPWQIYELVQPQFEKFYFKLNHSKDQLQVLQHHIQECKCVSVQELNQDKKFLDKCQQLSNILSKERLKIKRIKIIFDTNLKQNESQFYQVFPDFNAKKEKIFLILRSQQQTLAKKNQQALKFLVQLKNQVNKVKKGKNVDTSNKIFSRKIKDLFQQINKSIIQSQIIQQFEKQIEEEINK